MDNFYNVVQGLIDRGSTLIHAESPDVADLVALCYEFAAFCAILSAADSLAKLSGGTPLFEEFANVLFALYAVLMSKTALEMTKRAKTDSGSSAGDATEEALRRAKNFLLN